MKTWSWFPRSIDDNPRFFLPIFRTLVRSDANHHSTPFPAHTHPALAECAGSIHFFKKKPFKLDPETPEARSVRILQPQVDAYEAAVSKGSAPPISYEQHCWHYTELQRLRSVLAAKRIPDPYPPASQKDPVSAFRRALARTIPSIEAYDAWLKNPVGEPPITGKEYAELVKKYKDMKEQIVEYTHEYTQLEHDGITPLSTYVVTTVMAGGQGR